MYLLTFYVSLLILFQSISTAVGAPNESPVPRGEIPEFTPGELLIREDDSGSHAANFERTISET